MNRLLAALIGAIAVLLAACAPDSAPEAPKPEPESVASQSPDEPKSANAAQARLRPEQIVQFEEGSLVCLTREALAAVTGSAVRGEVTKVNGFMISPENPDGQCLMIPADKRMKILSVQYSEKGDGSFGILEVVGEGSSATNGAWAFTVGAKVVE